jgi:hypothetical protein
MGQINKCTEKLQITDPFTQDRVPPDGSPWATCVSTYGIVHLCLYLHLENLVGFLFFLRKKMLLVPLTREGQERERKEGKDTFFGKLQVHKENVCVSLCVCD